MYDKALKIDPKDGETYYNKGKQLIIEIGVALFFL